MIHFSRLLFTALFTFLSHHAWAQELPKYQTQQAHSVATLISENEQLRLGTNWLGLHIELEPEWHTYWLNPGDSASAPQLALQSPADIKIKQIHFPTPRRINVGPLTSFGYEKNVVLLLEIEVPVSYANGSSVELALDAEWLVCKEECIPGVFLFKRSWTVAENPSPSAEHSLIANSRQQLPSNGVIKTQFSMKGETTQLLLPEVLANQVHDIFPFQNTLVTNQKPAIDAQIAVFSNSQTATTSGSEVEKFLAITEKGSVVLEAHKHLGGLLTMLLFSFIGGLILNLMPCVFPVLTLKAYSVLQQDRQKILTSNLLYVAGVILSFLTLAGFIAFVRESGQALGWGFQLQSPSFVIFLILLFIIMALSCLDWLPLSMGSFANFGQSWTRGQGLTSSFFTGVFAVVVASPCTAPFMGAAMGYALSQSPVVIFLIFGMIGVGLSFPFLVLALFPQTATWLPKPGRWLIVFKKMMALPLLATAAWLGWVLFLQLQSSQPLPLGSEWEKYSPQYLEDSKNSGQPVFVNATAAWCISCQVHERLVFQDERVKTYFKENNFRLIKADWTKKDAEIRALLAEHNRAGVPLYLYFPPNKTRPIILPELLTVDLFLDSVKGL